MVLKYKIIESMKRYKSLNQQTKLDEGKFVPVSKVDTRRILSPHKVEALEDGINCKFGSWDLLGSLKR